MRNDRVEHIQSARSPCADPSRPRHGGCSRTIDGTDHDWTSHLVDHHDARHSGDHHDHDHDHHDHDDDGP